MTAPSLACNDLTITVEDRLLVRDLNLSVDPGAFVCVLGTNGVGKTLTLQALAGLRTVDTGKVQLGGELITTLSRRDIALRLGMLLQIHEDAFPLTVMDSVLMGRYPHMALWQWPDQEDKDAVRAALEQFDLTGLEARPLAELSGGERERVAIATLYVQSPDIWLLDEPMNHLDPQHQLQVMNTLRERAGAGKTIVASMHNPAMAMRFADQVLLLFGDGDWEYGPVTELLEPARLERAYHTPFHYYESATERLLLPA